MRTRPAIVDNHRCSTAAPSVVALLLASLVAACSNPDVKGHQPGPDTASTHDGGRPSNAAHGAEAGVSFADADVALDASKYAAHDASAPREAGAHAPDASHGDFVARDAQAAPPTEFDASRAFTDAATCEVDACNAAGSCLRRDQWTACSCAPSQLPACAFPRFRAIGTSRTDREHSLYLLSGDGHVVAGAHSFDSASPTVGVTWTPEDGLQPLPQDPAGPTLPTGLNADGSVITGVVELGRGEKLDVVWTDRALSRVSPDAGLEPPRDHTGRVPLDGTAATRYFEVFDASADGRVLVGRTRRNSDNSRAEAAFWTRDDGVQFLSDYLTAQGVDLHDWDLWHINAVSSDGNTMLGLGIGPDVGYRWYLQLVQP